jgi:RimJ/RimL family protein N-acetyltransferase
MSAENCWNVSKQMKLVNLTEADREFKISMETDRGLRENSGGIRTIEQIEKAFSGTLARIAAGTGWSFKIIFDEQVAGVVSLWEKNWGETTINEMGWTILPEFQNKGIASQAVTAVLAKSIEERKFSVVHAFPGVANTASNRVCEKAGFTKIEEVTYEYNGCHVRCNHWQKDLF